jgi:hypothetical protein
VFVGHVGAGLAIKAAAPRLNLGALLAAALFADLLLWTLVGLGVERVGEPIRAGGARFLTFTFPYSHGLVASAIAALAAAAAAWVVLGVRVPHRSRLATALACAVASHVVLDLVVHVPDLPVAGDASPKLGLGLWRAMPVALAVEIGLATAATLAWLAIVRPTRGRGAVIVIAVAITAALTAAGPYVGGDLPAPRELAATSFVVLAAVVAAGFVAERRVGLLAPAARAAATPGAGKARL